jgi:hypothetical protein
VIAVEIERCTRCRRDTRWSPSGMRNGDTPLVQLWRCMVCLHERAQLGRGKGRVVDVARLAEMIVNERRRGAVADRETARLDFEDARGHVAEAIYEAYTKWDPKRNPSLISWVTWKARMALTNWFRDELGQFTPKAHAWAYSIDALEDKRSLDGSEDEWADSESVTAGESRVDAAAASADANLTHVLVLIEDDETRETLRNIVLPIALGFSHAEVGLLHGMTEAWVGAQLRKIRTRGDLRLPA